MQGLSWLHKALTGFVLVLMIVSCGLRKGHSLKAGHADSVLFDLGVAMKYEKMLALTDSFEFEGDLSALDANRWRGVAYYHQEQSSQAEVYFRKALECPVKSESDQMSYNKVARRLSELLLVKGDFEGALRITIPAVKKMRETGIGSDIDYAIMLNNIGCCQLNMGRDAEANESFVEAREHYANRWNTDSTSRGLQEAIIGTVNTSMAYINTRRYGEAIYWIDRAEMLLDKYREYPDALYTYFDEYQGKIEIMRAVALQGLKREEDAATSYQAYLETDYSKTPNGHVNANDYLMAAQRYEEAADNYKYLDQVFHNMGMTASTLDNIQLYLLPKYHSNAKSGRADSARVSAQRILGVLDDAIVGQKNSATAELATIYDTQGKETEIARQQAEMSKLRFWWTAILLVVVFVFFVVYTLFKRKSTQRLAAAHEQLKQAYDQLEEATAHRERIESELRIARDIQMSMVPNIFPVREGLDIHALMEPAKEVGGDLYGYLLLGDDLYFCLGDVSGKGVPASLFMAQATRLFRTLATQHMMPAEIATRMNSALSEGNDQGMFVTMFIGLINLKDGSMSYCNAGHNPPFIGDEQGGSFLEMLPNAPIGLWPDLEFSGEQMDDIRGRLLVVYTDGLNEAENPMQDQFGEEKLLEILKTMNHAKAKEVVESLREAVQQHRNGAEPNDDLTIMSLRVG